MQENTMPTMHQTQKDKDLINAIMAHDLLEIKRLINQGANVDHVQYFYEDDCTRSPFSVALQTKIKHHQKTFYDILLVLLDSGASPNLQIHRGILEHWGLKSPLSGIVIDKIAEFQQLKEKLRLLRMLKSKGMDFNRQEHYFGQKWGRGCNNWTCFVRWYQEQTKQKNFEQICKEREEELRRNYEADLQFQKEYQEWVKQFQYVESVRSITQCHPSIQIVEYQPFKIDLPEQIFMAKKHFQNIDEELIIGIINLGINPNSYNSSHYYERKRGRYEYGEYIQNEEIYETVLHRAIMCNSYKIVKLLLQKGAKVQSKFKFTIETLQNPGTWPHSYKIKKKIQNEEDLHSALKQRANLSKYDISQPEEVIKQTLREIGFRIYKYKNYIVQADIPQKCFQNIEISCIQLGELLKVNPAIIDLLKQYDC